MVQVAQSDGSRWACTRDLVPSLDGSCPGASWPRASWPASRWRRPTVGSWIFRGWSWSVRRASAGVV